MEWRLEFSYFILLVVAMLAMNIFSGYGLFQSNLIGATLGILTIIVAMHLVKEIIFEDSYAKKIFAAAEYSLLLVLAAMFFNDVLRSLNISTVYSNYLAGLGFLLSTVLVIIASFASMAKKLA